MEVIYTLIPGMIFLGLMIVGVLIWAVRKGQYDDLEGDGQRILMDDDDDPPPRAGTNKRPGRNFPDSDED